MQSSKLTVLTLAVAAALAVTGCGKKDNAASAQIHGIL